MTNKVHIALFQILRDTLCSVTRYTKTTPIRATLGSKISSCSNATRTHERTHTHTNWKEMFVYRFKTVYCDVILTSEIGTLSTRFN